MKIKLKTTNIDSYYGQIYMENALININRTILLFDKLLNDDNIPFEEYIDIINRIYKVQITNNDLLRISSIILDDNCKCAIIKTNMMYDVISGLEVTNYFEYFEEEYNLNLKIAFTDDDIIQYDHFYTSSEINNMIKDKKIVLLEFVLDEENDYDFYEEYEYNGLSPINNILDLFTNIKDLNEEYVPSIQSYLKNFFTKDRIINDYKRYIHILNIKLDFLEKYISKINNYWFTKNNMFDNVLLECKRLKRVIKKGI